MSSFDIHQATVIDRPAANIRPSNESDGQSKYCRHALTAFATTATQNTTNAISQILSVLRVIACTFPSLMGVSGVLPFYHRWDTTYCCLRGLDSTGGKQTAESEYNFI